MTCQGHQEAEGIRKHHIGDVWTKCSEQHIDVKNDEAWPAYRWFRREVDDADVWEPSRRNSGEERWKKKRKEKSKV